MKNNNQNFSHHLFKIIKNSISHEFLWKFFSLISAIFMWFIVMNIINPTEIKNFTSPVTFENMNILNENGYVVSNLTDFEDLSISIKVEGTRPALDELSKTENKNNIKAKIDLSKIEINSEDSFPRTYSMIIVPTLPSSSYMYNYDIASYYPTITEIIIDKAGTKTVPVELKTYGSPLSGYVAGKAYSDIKEVTVTGPKSEVSKVEKVIATIDITNEKGMVLKNCSMKVCDDNDALLDNFIVTPESIPVSVEIKKSSTVKIDKPRTIGELPDHLELLSLEWSPKSIDVTSSDDIIPESITLPPIDLTTINKETTTVIDISDILNRAGLETDKNGNKITVTIKVGVKSAEEYVIPSNIIKITGLAPNLNVSIPDNLNIEIGGVNNIDIAALAPTIDLSDLNEGKHNVPVKLTLPENAVLKDTATINIEITKNTILAEEISTEKESSSHIENTTIESSETSVVENENQNQ